MSGQRDLMDFLLDPGCEFVLRDIQIVVHLKPKPETGRIPEVPGKPQCRIGSDTALPVNDLVDPAGRNPQVMTELILADLEGLQKLLVQNLPRMYGWYLLHSSPPVVIDYLNIMRVSVTPDETNSPPVVYTYAELPLSISRQGLELISWGHAKIIDC